MDNSLTQIYDDILNAVYQTAVDLDKLPTALSAVRRCANVRSAILALGDRHSSSFELDECFLAPRANEESFHHCTVSVTPRCTGRSPVTTSNAETTARLPRYILDSTKYRDLFGEGGVEFPCSQLWTRGRPYGGFLALLNDSGRRELDGRAKALLEFITPHVRRSLRLRDRLLELEEHRDIAMDGLDRLAIGAALVDASGKVTFMNDHAESVLTAGQQVALHAGKIGADNLADNVRIVQMIERILNGQSENTAASEVISIKGVSGRSPLGLAAMRCNGVELPSATSGKRIKAVVFMRGGESSCVDRSDALRKLYGLSRAESRFVQTLCESNGEPLSELAEHLHVSVETVRSHLKEVFRKTATHRQSELIKLVVVGPASIDLRRCRD